MIKNNPQLNKNNANKSPSIKFHLGHSFAIKRVNENQQAVLMRINKAILLRNENDNRFHSHQSTANLKSRTQSATIPIFARLNLLYIYKKGKCVEMLTVSRMHVDSQKRLCHIGYIKFIRGHAY